MPNIYNNQVWQVLSMQEQVKNQFQQMQFDDSIERSNEKEIFLSYQKLYEFEQIRKNIQEFLLQVQGNRDIEVGDIISKFSARHLHKEISGTDLLNLIDKRIERMVKNKKIKRNWSEEDLKILFWVVNHHASVKKINSIQQMTYRDWKIIAGFIPGTTPRSCMFKILGLKKIRLSQQQWTQNQSNLLFSIVNKNQIQNWKSISQQLFIQNSDPLKIFRNAKQCKEHWSCYLNPQLKKGPWQIQEDILLLQNILQNKGKKKWTELVKYFNGRTQNALKNRFCLLIQKAMGQQCQRDELQNIQLALKMLKGRIKQKKRNSRSTESPNPKNLSIYAPVIVPGINQVVFLFSQFIISQP